ncbi:MAG TPA: PBP1A family penicillin-binding protein [Candidatus Acidoferrales bacterium]|nr:PBP1A family penicillin-binding protein [Candidatus Acidoferrales bacterium]
MERFYRATMKIGGGTLFGRLAFSFLLICAIAVGAAAGLLFVYTSDLPEIHALESYRPDVVTELYADDGQSIGTFALQRRILVTYSQIPKILREAILTTEDQHFEEHIGVDFPRVLEAAWHDIAHHRIAEGASTLTMQLAGGLFLNRADRSFRRKIEETMLAIQIERHYTKEQIFTMYCNQIYLGSGNYGFEAASEYYFSKPVSQVSLSEAALLAAIIRGPVYNPITHSERALARRNLVLLLMLHDGKVSKADYANAVKQPLGLHIDQPRNDLAPYFVEEIRQYLEHTYGTAAVHEQGLRVYTTLNARMQKAADQAVRDGLHAFDRRHGWRGRLPNILDQGLGPLDKYQNDDWRGPIEKGDYVTGLVTSVQPTFGLIKIGSYHAMLTPADFTWTGHKQPKDLLRAGDLVCVSIKGISGTTAEVQLEQEPTAQAALVAIDNGTGEVKALVGGYDFQESKFDRATQALRQTGSSFKVYVYSEAMDQGASPFDTIVDEPVTYRVGGQDYSPHNYDEKFEGRITLRRALADSRNVPAVRLLDHVGIQNVIELARKFGITSPLQPVLPLALGASELTLIEHTSGFSVFPDDGIHIEPHYIRRVTSYDGAVLEEARPQVTEAIPPDVARTMVAMLEDVVQFGTGVRAKELGRPSAGKTGTTNDFTDAWYIGFTPQMTTGVWVGNDDKRISLGKKETGARAALPIWLEFMQQAMQGMPVESFPGVIPLEKLAPQHAVQVDTADTAPPTDAAEQGLAESATPEKSSASAAEAKPGTVPTKAPGEKPAPPPIPQSPQSPSASPAASTSASPTASPAAPPNTPKPVPPISAVPTPTPHSPSPTKPQPQPQP